MNKNNKVDKFLLFLIYAGLFVIFLSPLLVNNGFYYPYITLKNFSFRIAVELMTLSWFMLAIRNKKYQATFSLPILSVAIFTTIIFLADSFGLAPYRSYWGNFERMEGLMTFIHFVAYVLILAGVVKTKRQWAILANFSLVIALIVGIMACFELVVHPKALSASTMGNSAYLAIYIIFHIFISAFLFYNGRKNFKRWSYSYLGMIGFFFLILYNTGSRGSFLGILAGFFTFGIIMGLKSRRSAPKRIIIYALISILAFTTLLWSVKDTTFIQHNKILSRLVNTSSSSKTRFTVWNIALQGIMEHPLLGLGQENFNYVFDHYYDPGMGDEEAWYDRAHNVILDWTVSGGLLGGLAYLGMFILTLWYLWKPSQTKNLSVTEKALLSGLLASYFVHNLFIFDYINSYVLFFSLIAFVSCQDFMKNEIATDKKQEKIGIFLTAFLSLYMVYSFVAINIPAIKVARDLPYTLRLGEIGKTEEALIRIKEAAKIHPLSAEEMTELMGRIAFNLPMDQGMSDEVRKKYLGEALEKLAESAASFPQTMRKIYVYHSLSAEINDPNTEKIFLEALRISPRRQLTYTTMIEYYLQKKSFKKADSLAKINYENDPKVLNSKALYALTSIYNGNIPLSDILLEQVPLDKYVIDNKILDAYHFVQRKDKILEFLNKRVVYNPSNPDYHLRLGLYYTEADRPADADREYKIAKELTQKMLLK